MDIIVCCLVEVIGPWLFMDNGTSLGFTEQNMWYKNIELGDSSNSVVFQESGLFLISAQVRENVISLQRG